MLGKRISVSLGATGDARLHSTLNRLGHPFREWPGNKFDQQARMACDDCNNGWMSKLEMEVRPHIEPMILNRREHLLNDVAQLVIATWATKTAMVMEYLDPSKATYYTARERRFLMDESRPPLGTRVWLGHNGDRFHVFASATTLVSADGETTTHEASFCIGTLIVQVFSERSMAA